MDGEFFTDLEVHPLAQIVPMLSEDQLTDLAADIAEHGLQHPIIRTVDGKTLIDGRNRLRACVLAGVEPIFDDRVTTEEEARAIIASENIQRRNLSASQHAMWTAFLYPEPRSLTELRTASEQVLLSKARAVLRHAPEKARAIAMGAPGISLNVEYEEAINFSKRLEQQEAEDRRLRQVAPHLMRRVDNGELTRTEARTLWDEENREARESRRIVFQALYEFSRLTRGISGTPAIMQLPDWLTIDEYDTEFREFFKGGRKQLIEEAEAAQQAADTLYALIHKLGWRGKR